MRAEMRGAPAQAMLRYGDGVVQVRRAAALHAVPGTMKTGTVWSEPQN
jgi:hypothetical protein